MSYGLKIVIAAVLLLSLAIITAAQNQALAFEVASIKPNRSASRFAGGSCHGMDSKYGPAAPLVPPLGRCILIRTTLKEAINYAYSLNLSFLQIDTMIKGGASWTSTDVFDVETKAEDSAVTKAQLLEMLQKLLADRFKLQIHRETKEVPGYILVAAKNGPKLGASKTPDAHPSTLARLGRVSAKNATLSESLVRFLNEGSAVDGPVVDKSRMTGKYDFTLTWSPDFGPATASAVASDPSGPSLFTALQEQLGLRLDRQKETVEIIVIDQAEKPSEN